MALRFAGGPSPFSGVRSLEGLDRPPKGSDRHEELPFGFVDGRHDVFSLGAEERLRDGADPFTLTLDRVGDHVEFVGGR